MNRFDNFRPKRLEEFRGAEQAAAAQYEDMESMSRKCYRCGGTKTIVGEINTTDMGRATSFIIRRKELRRLWARAIGLCAGALIAREAVACLDCGFLSSSVDPGVLASSIRKHGSLECCQRFGFEQQD